MKIYLIDQDSYVLGTLPIGPGWPEEAQKVADETAAFITAVMGNEAGTFQSAPLTTTQAPKQVHLDTQDDLDALKAVRAVHDRNHAAELAAYRERITRLEGVVTSQAVELEGLWTALEYIASLANDGMAADPGAVYSVLDRIKALAEERP